MQKLKRPVAERVSKAWIEGYIEGRTQSGIRAVKNPNTGKDAEEWQAGYFRGVTCRHYIEETPSNDVKVNHAVVELRRAKGERV